MKRHFFPLLLLAALAWLPAHHALAQDKPVLNSAPPGPPPAAPSPVQPAPTPTTPEPATPAPEPAPATTVPTPQPTPDAPSGLNFPNRNLPQSGDDEKLQTKKFIYTNFGLGFSSYNQVSQFNISAAPALGFRITDKFAVGPGISYAYSSYSVPNGYAITAAGASSVSTSSLGLKAFAQYIVYKEFFVHAEYEVTNAELLGEDGPVYLRKVKRTVTSPLAGIGYRSYLGEKAAVDIVGLYNFDNTIYSLYPGLVIRFSFLFNIGK
jgi:hypothetical protein